MDPRRFEELSRRVGAAASRRAAVLAAIAGVPVALGLWPDAAEAGLPIVNCKPPGKSCDKNQKCCSQRCRRRRCICNKKGRPCWEPLEGAECCSQKCRGGKCG